MKKLSLVFLIVLSMLLLCSCSKPSFKPDEKVFFSRPKDTNLEFWITEKFDDLDLSTCEREHLYYENVVYYGTGYKSGDEEVVIYYFNPYPTPKATEPLYITRIDITDPNVTVYGLTINSPQEEFVEKMQENGFVTTTTVNNTPAVKKVICTLQFSRGNGLRSGWNMNRKLKNNYLP